VGGDQDGWRKGELRTWDRRVIRTFGWVLGDSKLTYAVLVIKFCQKWNRNRNDVAIVDCYIYRLKIKQHVITASFYIPYYRTTCSYRTTHIHQNCQLLAVCAVSLVSSLLILFIYFKTVRLDYEVPEIEMETKYVPNCVVNTLWH